MNKEFMRLLRALDKVDARYLLVGALAIEHYGEPRSTRHMDLWLDDSPENLERVYRALADFGAPAIAVDHLNAAPPLDVVWIGVPPNRIDLSKGVRGLDKVSCLHLCNAVLHRLVSSFARRRLSQRGTNHDNEKGAALQVPFPFEVAHWVSPLRFIGIVFFTMKRPVALRSRTN